MKHIPSFLTLVLALMCLAGCNQKKQAAVADAKDSVAVQVDSAIYGVIGEGTTMHVLELLTEDGKTLSLAINQDSCSDVQGGIFAGDRVSVIMRQGGTEGLEVAKLVNMTSLLGKWTSLDRNFEIQEDGIVVSTVKAESRPYTQWSMCNGNIILNTDTFDILLLGPDSMSIENREGIYVYKRQK